MIDMRRGETCILDTISILGALRPQTIKSNSGNPAEDSKGQSRLICYVQERYHQYRRHASFADPLNKNDYQASSEMAKKIHCDGIKYTRKRRVSFLQGTYKSNE